MAINKLAVPYVEQLAVNLSNPNAAKGLNSTQWQQVARTYRHIHGEGQEWERLFDEFGSSQWADDLFLNANPANDRAEYLSIYVNGSYITQGLFEEYWAAHIERHAPLGISTWWPGGAQNGIGRLAYGVSGTDTTIRFFRQTSGLPASDHINGTSNTVFPAIRSTISPTATAHSANTAEYVSWLRIDDEIILLSDDVNDFSYNSGNGVVILDNCVRGAWGTSAVSHVGCAGDINSNVGDQVFFPVYIGNDNAAATDVGLSGNPANDDLSQYLRYGIYFWQDDTNGALHDGARIVSDLAHRELVGQSDYPAISETLPTTITAVNTINNQFTSGSNHGLQVGDEVRFTGVQIPSEIRSHTTYYVESTPNGTTFTVSTTSGGATLNLNTNTIQSMSISRPMRSPSQVGITTIWLDVSSEKRYNNADPYGAQVDPWDTVDNQVSSDSTWQSRQLEKLSLLKTDLETDDGFSNLSFSVNNFSAFAADDRVDHIAAYQTYEWCVLEHWMQKSALMVNQINQLCSIMGNNYKALVWVKENEFLDSVDSDITRDRYIRRAYGSYLLAQNLSATNVQLMGKFHAGSKVYEPLTDWINQGETVHREIFLWDWGNPVTPASPTSANDLLDGSGLYVREYENGIILVNLTGSALNFALDGSKTWSDVLSETNMSGSLSTVSGSVSVPAYDARFYLHDTAGSSDEIDFSDQFTQSANLEDEVEWSVDSGDIDIVDNVAEVIGSATPRYWVDGATSGNHYAEVTVAAHGSHPNDLGPGVMVRFEDATGYRYHAWYHGVNQAIQLFKVDAGGVTFLAGSPVVLSVPYTVRLTAEDDNIIVRVDGSELINITDSSVSTSNTYTGIIASSDSAGSQWERFETGDLTNTITRYSYNGAGFDTTTTKFWDGSQWMATAAANVTSFSDEFSVIQGVDLDSRTGWQKSYGAINVSSSQAVLSGTNSTRYYVEQVSTSNHYIEADIVNNSSADAAPGIIARYDNNNTDMYFARYHNTLGELQLWQILAGSWTKLGSSSMSLTAPYKLRLQAVGTTIEVLVNDTAQISETDSAISAGLGTGLLAGASDNPGAWDNFVTGDII